MILTLISWIWIGVTAFICGFGALQILFPRKEKRYWELDCYLLAGLCVLTAYAQTFSLFFKVGAAATGVLALACVCLGVFLRKQLVSYIRQFWKKGYGYKLIVFLFLSIIMLLLTIQPANQYDTGLYHAQSIRWIEEYGVVKGLGNLHNRLAYNSAVFCLQALFGLKFAVGQSLHTVNGFIALLMSVYAVNTLHVWDRKKLQTSDLFKLALLCYICVMDSRYDIASPGSDIAALSLMLYLSAKWCENREQDKKDIHAYGVLCLLAVWGVTLKLSVAMLVFLTVYPAVELIRTRHWAVIGRYLLTGFLIVLPFLARNVMISGYLVYPCASIDLFSVDWKMNGSIAQYDSMEIREWGRGVSSSKYYGNPFPVWFPLWFGKLSVLFQGLFVMNIAALAATGGYTVWCVLRRKDGRRLNLLLVSAAGLIMWFVSAPLLRYGAVYMLLLPILYIGMGLDKCYAKEEAGNLKTIGNLIVVVLVGMCLVQAGALAVSYGIPSWKRQADYNWGNATAVELNGYEFYIGAESDMVGYHYFPGTPNQERLNCVEFRAEKLEDGFRLKEEYRHKKMRTNGRIIEP